MIALATSCAADPERFACHRYEGRSKYVNHQGEKKPSNLGFGDR